VYGLECERIGNQLVRVIVEPQSALGRAREAPGPVGFEYLRYVSIVTIHFGLTKRMEAVGIEPTQGSRRLV
jgi:hypothetical protein